MSFMRPSTPTIIAPAMAPPTPPPTFGSSPVGERPGKKSMQTTFLGASVLPPSQGTGAKTLLGQ